MNQPGIILQLGGAVASLQDQAVIFADLDAAPIYIRFALVELNSGDHLIPESVVDDWGKEITGLNLYGWIRDNGPYFPRAEVFGRKIDGLRFQRFLRELENEARYPCYVYSNPDSPVEHGILVAGIITPDTSLLETKVGCKPDWAMGLLAKADVQWWCANPEIPEHRTQILELLLGNST